MERATLAVEAPLRRVVGSNRLNPLPHAGTISVFLFGVVTITGIYLTMFFEFGFEDSYRSVAAMEAHVIQRAMRGIHRYSSAALVLTAVVHAWRIFVMQRFTGPRRWRWLTGAFGVLIVWMAGVTGYWLIWDQRAQALNEATAALFEPVWPGLAVGVAVPEGSGWTWLLLIWTLHLLLTVLLGWVLWRHLRRTRHAWLPPRRWSWMMIGALTVASVVFPAGMLPPADPGIAPGALPLDPFVLFLLPALLSPWRWAAVFVGASIGVVLSTLPWLLRKSDPPVAHVIAEACTGCELCVIDCPYQALTMSGNDDRAIAVLDPHRCVGCGICLGSCAFDAIGGFGDDPLIDLSLSGPVALVCERHHRTGEVPAGATVISVGCAGVLSPRSVATLLDRGAGGVHVIGCPPGDCAYGMGNVITSERLTSHRRPLLPRRYDADVFQDWTSPSNLEEALSRPGAHPQADVRRLPPGWRVMVPAALVVFASVLAVRWATDAPFGAEVETATVRIVVDHRPGGALEGSIHPGPGPATLEVKVEGASVETITLDPSSATREVLDVQSEQGPRQVEVAVVAGSTRSAVFRGVVDLRAGERFVVEVFDAPPEPDVVLGRKLFEGAGLGANLGCEICHSIRPGEDGVGPSLAGIGSTAGDRVEGMGAEEYLRQSILDPDAYIVDGYRSGQMLEGYRERLSGAEVDALIKYMLSLP